MIAKQNASYNIKCLACFKKHNLSLHLGNNLANESTKGLGPSVHATKTSDQHSDSSSSEESESEPEV